MLARMIDPGTAAELLRSLMPQSGLRSVEIADVTAREDWFVQYSAQLDDGSRRLLTAQRFLGGDFPGMTTRLRRQAEWAGLTRFVAELPEAGVLLYPFPLDPKIKRLARAADPQRAIGKLRTVLADAAGCDGCGVEALRYVPGKRCQFQFELRRNGREALTVLGKVFRDERGEELYNAMRKVEALFARAGDPAVVITPRALAYVRDWFMVVQEKVSGRTLYAMLHAGAAEDRHLISSARALALLHQGSLDVSGRHGAAEERAMIEKGASDLAGVHRLEPEFSAVLGEVRGFSESLSPSPMVPVHRDFYDKQLLFDGPRTALIDFDTLSLGSAEVDVANFIAHLHLRSMQQAIPARAAERWSNVFLAEYGTHDSGRLAFFLAATYFRLACKYRLRPGGDRLSGELLRLASLQLNGVQLNGVPA